MGFIHDIKRVLKVLPAKRQNLLFSATFSDEIKTLADSLLNAPAMIEVARRNSTVDVIGQVVHPVDREKKGALLIHLIKTGDWDQVLVFTRTKHGANRLAEHLNHAGISAMAIHGNKSQGARTRALSDFKEPTSKCWWPPTSPRAASTSKSCRTWSLRPAQRAGRLRAPHRPHRPRRRHRRGGVAGVRRRKGFPARHRAPDQARDPASGDSRLRARPHAKAQPILMGRGQGQGRGGNGRSGGGRGQNQPRQPAKQTSSRAAPGKAPVRPGGGPKAPARAPLHRTGGRGR